MSYRQERYTGPYYRCKCGVIKSGPYARARANIHVIKDHFKVKSRIALQKKLGIDDVDYSILLDNYVKYIPWKEVQKMKEDNQNELS